MDDMGTDRSTPGQAPASRSLRPAEPRQPADTEGTGATDRRFGYAFHAKLLVLLGLAAATAMAGGVEADDRQSAAELADLIEICQVPDPKTPSSAFIVDRSEPVQLDKDYWLKDYWMRYRCKETCDDWRQCQVEAYHGYDGGIVYHGRQRDLAKQSVAFVVDDMGGYLIYTTEGGDKTIFAHGGGGGVGYDPSVEFLEKHGSANTVVMSWEAGFAPPDIPEPPPFPVSWGWYTRSSADAERVPDLNRRVAVAVAWAHENLAGPSTFGTMGCSMGAQATFGAVLWHGLDDIVDYQALGGGPPLYDINAGCGRRGYERGYCDLDGGVACTEDADCKGVSENSLCRVPETIPADWAYESVVNHAHATTACRIAEGGDEPYAPFDESGMMSAHDGDWDIDHSIDLFVDVGADYDPWRSSGGDEHWSLGHFMYAYNRMNMEPGSDKRWHASENSAHCESFSNKATMNVILTRMGLGEPQ